MDSLIIRHGEERDLPELVAIYNHFVQTSHCTFDTNDFTVETRRSWFDQFTQGSPYQLLVGELDGKCIAYACSGPFRPKPAYSTSVETSVYVDPSIHTRGIGKKIYSRLMEQLETHSKVHRAYGLISVPNEASVALHISLGFKHVGTLHEVGKKFGKFCDVVWYERDL